LTWFLVFRRNRTDPYTGPVFTVEKQRLKQLIVERGTVESAENSEITCRVKSGAKGGANATTIKWVIDDGTQVERGQKIMELDASGAEEQLKTQNITVSKARGDWVYAVENLDIVESQNYSDVKKAENDRILALLDLFKYTGEVAGTHIAKLEQREPLQQYLAGAFLKDLRDSLEKDTSTLNSEVIQMLNDIEGRIGLARSDREQALDRSSWSTRMVNRKLLSQSQADADKAKLESTEYALKKVQGELDIYKKYTLEKTATDLWSKFKEAERTLDRQKTQAKAKKTQAASDRDIKKAVLQMEDEKRQDIEDEIRKCYIQAPQDGMVVYFVPESNRFGVGSQSSIIAQGEPVKEGQKMIRIPNLSKMQVNVRVHEAMVTKVKGEKRNYTGYSERLRAAFNTSLSDPLSLAGYNLGHLSMIEREDFRDKDEELLAEGQEAKMQFDAHPGKVYSGHVKSVATVASQADFISSDVKVYQTIVSIDGRVSDLKPGMSSEVTILAQEDAAPELVIPIQAVLGNVSMGAKRKCFVLDESKIPHERDIDVGMSNDKFVAVTKGLEQGELVVLSPKALLNEKSNLRAGTPSTRRGSEFDDESGSKKKGKKGGPGGPGGRPGGGRGGPEMQGDSPQGGSGFPVRGANKQ
jgi:multidrug efflux pump subunit AcrA (membrane-fusion protein)